MNALPFLIGALCVMAIAYRYYSAFIAAKIIALDPKRVTPAHRLNDGHNYQPTNKWVVFGHHFAAISGAGPLIGPVLATQFGFLPGYLWLVIGVCLGGAVHDFMILGASIRRNGKSLAEIARHEISPLAGVIGSIAILIIVIIALAGLGLAVVNALRESSWGTFTIAMTIPVALFVGWWMFKFRPGKIGEGSLIGVIGIFASVIVGGMIPHSLLEPYFTFSREGIIIGIAVYGFFASVLPVWLLLCPRDYISSYMKLGTVAALILSIIIVHPDLRMPAFTDYIHGGGPIIPGKVFPFVFITIACGAISGFHSLVASGTTPKMLDNETDARMVGYGAMLLEGVVGVIALIAACSLFPGDYFAINLTPQKFATLGMIPHNITDLSKAVGEVLTGRPGGAVSLAVGFAQIFSGIPGMTMLMSYWYHFAIMFEALFILTTIDAGTRVSRFLVRDINSALSAATGDLYILADVGHIKSMYRNRIFLELILALQKLSDAPIPNFLQSSRKFDEFEWDKRKNKLSLDNYGAAEVAAKIVEDKPRDHELEIRMKMMAKQEPAKAAAPARNYALEILHAVDRVLGLQADVNLLSGFVGGDLLFRRCLSAESFIARLPHESVSSEREFREVMEQWNVLIYEMSGGNKTDLSYYAKPAPETRVRWDINSLKLYYSSDIEQLIEEGKHQVAVGVAKIFQELLGKSQPASPVEWSTAYLKFLSKMELYFNWIWARVRE